MLMKVARVFSERAHLELRYTSFFDRVKPDKECLLLIINHAYKNTLTINFQINVLVNLTIVK